LNRSNSYLSDTPNDAIFDLKMVAPFIRPWIEQASQFADNERGQIRAFEQIAPMTSNTKVFNVVTATMLSGDYMLDMKTDERKTALSEPTILAKIRGSITNIKSNCLRNTHSPDSATMRRAFA